jgi:Mn-dependent DtxR family transcriptional regulator
MRTRLLETCRDLKQTHRKRNVRQVGHLQDLFRDAWSIEHKLSHDTRRNIERSICNLHTAPCGDFAINL